MWRVIYRHDFAVGLGAIRCVCRAIREVGGVERNADQSTLSVGEENRTRTRQTETAGRSVWLPGGILPRE